MNPLKLAKYMAVAEAWALFSKDEDTKVGAILVDPIDGDQISCGYNNPIRGGNDKKIPRTRVDGKYPYMIHAEQNAIALAAKKGRKLDKAISIQTLSPCTLCVRLLWQVGVTTIYFRDKYKDFDENLNMLDLKIELTPIGKYTKMIISVKE